MIFVQFFVLASLTLAVIFLPIGSGDRIPFRCDLTIEKLLRQVCRQTFPIRSPMIVSFSLSSFVLNWHEFDFFRGQNLIKHLKNRCICSKILQINVLKIAKRTFNHLHHILKHNFRKIPVVRIPSLTNTDSLVT